jgi:hypothetical protein
MKMCRRCLCLYFTTNYWNSRTDTFFGWQTTDLNFKSTTDRHHGTGGDYFPNHPAEDVPKRVPRYDELKGKPRPKFQVAINNKNT